MLVERHRGRKQPPAQVESLLSSPFWKHFYAQVSLKTWAHRESSQKKKTSWSNVSFSCSSSPPQVKPSCSYFLLLYFFPACVAVSFSLQTHSASVAQHELCCSVWHFEGFKNYRLVVQHCFSADSATLLHVTLFLLASNAPSRPKSDFYARTSDFSKLSPSSLCDLCSALSCCFSCQVWSSCKGLPDVAVLVSAVSQLPWFVYQ